MVSLSIMGGRLTRTEDGKQYTRMSAKPECGTPGFSFPFPDRDSVVARRGVAVPPTPLSREDGQSEDCVEIKARCATPNTGRVHLDSVQLVL